MRSSQQNTFRRTLSDLALAIRAAIRRPSGYPLSEHAAWTNRMEAFLEPAIERDASPLVRVSRQPHFYVLVADGGRNGALATLASLRAQSYRGLTCIVVGEAGATLASGAELNGTGTDSLAIPSSALSAWLATFNASLAEKPSDKWIVLTRAGDRLPAHSLEWFARKIFEHPDSTVLYSDDDCIDAAGKPGNPRFKPDWSPAHLRSTHYIGAAAALRGDAVAAAGGIGPETLRHGNYDLLLRISANPGIAPVHIPAVLFHRAAPGTGYRAQGSRYTDEASPATSYKLQATSHSDGAAPGSGYRAQGSRYTDEASPATSYELQATSHSDGAAPGSGYKVQGSRYADSAALGTGSKVQGSRYGADEAWENPEWCIEKLKAHLERSGSPGEVIPTLPGCWRVRYRLPDAPPMISIVIPTRNAVALLRQCVDSVLRKTTYPRFEVLVIDNQSDDPETLSYFREVAANPAVRVLRYDHPFNYSAINNFAAREARGEVLCFLNNDTEVITPGWLEEMAGQLLQSGTGAVGARLLYPDGRVQHAGVIVDSRYGADHLHVHCAGDDPGYCNRAMIAHESSAVTAACMLTWKRLYETLGGLNEVDLPVAFNDVDYCLRLQETGYRVVLDANTELLHHESATRGRENTPLKRLRAWRELRYLRKRWGSRLEHDPYYNPNLSKDRPHFARARVPSGIKTWRDHQA